MVVIQFRYLKRDGNKHYAIKVQADDFLLTNHDKNPDFYNNIFFMVVKNDFCIDINKNPKSKMNYANY